MTGYNQVENKMNSADLAETAKAAVDVAKEKSREALTDVSDAASRIAATVRDEGATRIEAVKDSVADGGQRLAESLRTASRDQDQNSFQARILGTVANGVSDVSTGLRHSSFGSMVRDAEHFARRNPGVFVAAAALAGFALVRFMRASGRENGDYRA